MEERDKRSRTTSDRTIRNRTTGRDLGQGSGRRPRSAGERPTRERPTGERRERPTRERPAGERQERERRTGERRERSPAADRTARRPAARRPQSRRRRKRNLTIKIILLVVLIAAAVVGAFLWKRYSPSKEQANLQEYYGIQQEGQLPVIDHDHIPEPQGMISEGKAYLQYEIVRDYINSRFYWDPNENILLYTLPTDMVSVEVGSTDYSVSRDKNSEDYVILKTEGSTAYIALDFIQKYTNMEYEVYDDPQRIVVQSDWGEKTVAEVKRDTAVRYRGGVKSPVLTEVAKNDQVTILENEENWRKVLTSDGFIGYVKKGALRKEETKDITREFEEPEYTSISKDYTINMAWHNVTNRNANSTVLQRIAETKGLTTIAPTWYHVKDTEGNLDSISSTDYVNYAHQANIEVWAAVRDFDGGIDSNEESLEFLSSTSSRENLINQLIADALQTGIDGINVDFEKISEECGEHFIQFIRELSVRCRQNGLVLSVDNYVPMGYNMQYDRKEQGIVADYVVIMGYDEHYAGSPEAGSVSSYNYVKDGIEATLEEVPKEKVISGIPFFTRLWEETPKTEEELAEQAGTEAAEYPTNVSSKALGMSAAKAAVEEAGAELVWDEETQQNYAEWTSGDTTYKIWLEDEKSLEAKLKLMKDNGLAGTAEWALGQEESGVWDLIRQYIN